MARTYPSHSDKQEPQARLASPRRFEPIPSSPIHGTTACPVRFGSQLRQQRNAAQRPIRQSSVDLKQEPVTSALSASVDGTTRAAFFTGGTIDTLLRIDDVVPAALGD